MEQRLREQQKLDKKPPLLSGALCTGSRLKRVSVC
jgi:hypothetical protein